MPVSQDRQTLAQMRRALVRDFFPELALQPHQIEAAQAPEIPISTVIERYADAFAGRPYRIWRHKPELARQINDRLAERLEGAPSAAARLSPATSSPYWHG
jgi:hypothetical protein